MSILVVYPMHMPYVEQLNVNKWDKNSSGSGCTKIDYCRRPGFNAFRFERHFEEILEGESESEVTITKLLRRD